MRSYFNDESRVGEIASWFVFLSLVDLLMTYLLLRSGLPFRESNPLAHWILRHWNVAGMSFYKFGLVAVVVLASEEIERRRASAGRLVLLGGCGATAFAIARGLYLYFG